MKNIKKSLTRVMGLWALVSGVLGFAPELRADAPLSVRMISPKYRNAIYATMPAPAVVKVRAKIDFTTEFTSSDLANSSLDVALSRDGVTIKTWAFAALSEDQVLELPVSGVQFVTTRSGPFVQDDNPYLFTFILKENGSPADTETLELNKYPAPPPGVNEVRIDDNNNLIINGVPSTVYGTYNYQASPAVFETLLDWGFEGFKLNASDLGGAPLNYKTFLAVGTLGSGLIPAITNYRQDPNLLAYILFDEPTTKTGYPYTPENVEATYLTTKAEDPYHPAGNVVYLLHTTASRAIKGFELGDMILLDVYPVRCVAKTDLRTVYKNYEMARSSAWADFAQWDLPMWGIPQMYDSGDVGQCSTYRFPFSTEEKNMVYLHVIGGAKALFPYVYQGHHVDRWEYYGNTIIGELKSLEDAILAPSAAQPATINPPTTSTLVSTHKQTATSDYIFLVNSTSKWNQGGGPKNTPISVEITFTEPGSDLVQVLVGDPEAPSTYPVVNNKVTVVLEGVDETHSGVMVLKRLKRGVNPTKTTSSGLLYSRATDTFNGTVYIQNVSTESAIGPFRVEFGNLPAGVTLVNATGSWANGPYIELAQPSLAPGETIAIPVRFANPSKIAISFTATTHGYLF